jgi:Uma2 family endonuclease
MAATTTGRMTEETYRALALTDAGKLVELWDGEPREKPGVSVEHSGVMGKLGFMIQAQLGWDAFLVRWNVARLRVSSGRYLIPDIAVVPIVLDRELRARPGTLDAFAAPLPLVVEVWSPSTGGYDVTTKLARYQERGDEEIWYIHPYERTLTAWLRQPDGTYRQTLHRQGVVHPASLPGVAIDLAALFAD